jgi:hypothetical protein
VKALLAAFALLGLAAQAPAQDGRPGPRGCDVARTRPLIGKARSALAEAQARRLSRAAIVRWVPNGAVVTMEFRPDRLNLYLDRRGRIARVRCG